jgi:hypothetical protein
MGPKFGDQGDVGLPTQTPWALGRRRSAASRDSFDIGPPISVAAGPRYGLGADSLPADVGVQRRQVYAEHLRRGFGRNIEVFLHRSSSIYVRISSRLTNRSKVPHDGDHKAYMWIINVNI